MLSILVPSSLEPNIFNTIITLENYFPTAQIITVNDRKRKGKGWAIREALTEATGDIIVFIDGDGDIQPKMIQRLLDYIDYYDIVVGKKNCSKLLSRRIITILSRFYIKLLFGIGVDSQTGVKAFRREALLPWITDSFAFDIEILYNAKKAGFTMAEVTVEATILRRMKFNSIWNCFKDSLRIYRDLHFRKGQEDYDEQYAVN
jgi:glycosyltransferase involved in cell wall biosynthesis